MISQRIWPVITATLLVGVLTYIFLPNQVQEYVRELPPRLLAAITASLLAGNLAWLVLFYYRPPLFRIASITSSSQCALEWRLSVASRLPHCDRLGSTRIGKPWNTRMEIEKRWVLLPI